MWSFFFLIPHALGWRLLGAVGWRLTGELSKSRQIKRDPENSYKAPFLRPSPRIWVQICRDLVGRVKWVPAKARKGDSGLVFSGLLALFSDFGLVFWSTDFRGRIFPLSDFGLVFESPIRTYFECHLVLLFSPLSADTGFHNHDGGYGLHGYNGRWSRKGPVFRSTSNLT